MRLTAAATLALMGALGCDRSEDVGLRITNNASDAPIELRVYPDSVGCGTLTNTFAAGFHPAALPSDELVRGVYPFGDMASLEGLEAGRYTVLAWSDPGACVATAAGCTTLTLPPVGDAQLSLSSITNRQFCTGACASQPFCQGITSDGGSPCPGCCTGREPCRDARGQPGRCSGGVCEPTSCAGEADGTQCVDDDLQLSTCCSQGCLQSGQPCPVDPPDVCNPPFNLSVGGACAIDMELEPGDGFAEGEALTAYLWFLAPDRSATDPQSGEVTFLPGSMVARRAVFQVATPDPLTQICEDRIGCMDGEQAFALGAVVLTNGSATIQGWGQHLFIWSSDERARAELNEVAYFSSRGVFLGLMDDVPAGLSVWRGTPGSYTRIDVAPVLDQVSECPPGGMACDLGGPVPAG